MCINDKHANWIVHIGVCFGCLGMSQVNKKKKQCIKMW